MNMNTYLRKLQDAKRYLFPFGIAGMTLLSGCLSSNVEDRDPAGFIGEREIPLNHFKNGQITIDGKLDDWGEMTKCSATMQQGMSAIGGSAHTDEDAALVKTAYDDHAFYVAVKVADKSFAPAKTEAELAKGDVIELFLDVRPVNPPKGEAGQKTDRYTEGVYQLRIAAPDKRNKIAVWNGGLSKSVPSNVLMAGVNTEDGYTLEVRFPFDGLHGKPSPERFGKPVGFAVMICDVDSDGSSSSHTAPWYYSINGLENYCKSPQNFSTTCNAKKTETVVGLAPRLEAGRNGVVFFQGFLNAQQCLEAENATAVDFRFEDSDFDRENDQAEAKVPKSNLKSKREIFKYPALRLEFLRDELTIQKPLQGRYYFSCRIPESGRLLQQTFYGEKKWGRMFLKRVSRRNLSNQEVLTLAKDSATNPPKNLGYDSFPSPVQLDPNFIFLGTKKLNGTYRPAMPPELLFYMSEKTAASECDDIPVWGRIVVAEKESGKALKQVDLKPLLLDNKFTLDTTGLKKGLYSVYFEFVTCDDAYAPEMVYYGRGTGVTFSSKTTLGVVKPYDQLLKTTLKDTDRMLTKAVYAGNAGKKQFPKDNLADACARSVWDMQLYEGSIYVGDGDWNRNRGPIDIWSFKPTANGNTLVFKKEFTVDDESVDRFRVYGNKLFVPGIDAADKPPKGEHQWDWGNFYIKENGKWSKHRNVPNGIHVLDAAESQGKIYISTGTESGGAVYESADKAKSWKVIGEPMGKAGIRRLWQIIPLKDFLLTTSDNKYDNYKCSDGKLTQVNVPLIPLCGKPFAFIQRLTVFKEGAVYFIHQYPDLEGIVAHPLYWIADFSKGAQLVEYFRDKNVVDIISRDGSCYVMTTEKVEKTENGETYRASIYKTADMSNWTKLADVKDLPCCPRSFEFVDGHFYLALASGYWQKKANDASGNIYRLDY